MTALEIYREDRGSRKNPETRRARQEYYTLLRDTLHDELMREGRSELLEQMIADCGDGRALPLLEYAALRECAAMIVDGRPMQDASEFVPHIRRGGDRPLAWRELERGAAFRVDDPELPQTLRRLKSVSWQLVRMRDQTLAPDAERASQREIEGLMALNRTLEENNAALRAEREELRARIAELEEGYISEQLKHRLEVRRRQAESELQQEYEQKRQAQADMLRRALAQAAADEQHRIDAAQRLAEDSRRARAAEYERLHTGLQRQMAELQAQLNTRIKDWQAQLNAADHRFLAQSFAALSGTIRRETTQLLAHAQADERLTVSLAGLQAALDTQLKQMEQALQLLGLQVYRPQPGDPFDPRLHSPASAHAQDAPPEEAEVSAVETPGVLLIRAGGQDEPLVRAVVHTRRRDGR